MADLSHPFDPGTSCIEGTHYFKVIDIKESYRKGVYSEWLDEVVYLRCYNCGDYHEVHRSLPARDYLDIEKDLYHERAECLIKYQDKEC